MAWTYTHDPENHPRDGVRYLVGDTQEPGLVDDRVVDWALTTYAGDITAAAAEIARGLAAQYAQEASSAQIGRVREEYADRATLMAERATEIEASGGNLAAGPIAPQVRISDRETAFSDTDRTPTQFGTGQMDNLRSGSRTRDWRQ